MSKKLGDKIGTIVGIVLILVGIIFPVMMIFAADAVVAVFSLLGGQNTDASPLFYLLYGIPFLLIGGFVLWRSKD